MYRRDCYLPDGTRKKTREGSLFSNMNSRCGLRYKATNLTYEKCSVSDNFRDFQFFARWCNEQIGFNKMDSNGCYWELDKDILIKGNKIYSENTCVFVPKVINSFFVKADKIRGNLPIGVRAHSKYTNKFQSSVTNPFTRKVQYCGIYQSIEEAFEAYSKQKHKIAVELAVMFKDEIRNDVYNVLLNYYPDIKD